VPKRSHHNMTKRSMTKRSMTKRSMTTRSMTKRSMTKRSMTTRSMTKRSMTKRSMTKRSMTKRSMTTRSMTTLSQAIVRPTVSLRDKYPPRKTEFDILGNKIPMKSFKEFNISIAQAWGYVDTIHPVWAGGGLVTQLSRHEQEAINRLVEDFA
jgi:hypothetical protein